MPPTLISKIKTKSKLLGEFSSVVKRDIIKLDKALFKMNKAETSDILKIESGFHILRCDKIHPPGTLSFDEAGPKA